MIEEVVRVRSPRQTIRLCRHPEQGLVLLLDDVVQFAQSTEELYHEYLGLLPLLFGRPRRVFVGGGGDGLVAARLLNWPEIREIVVCDYDRRLTDLARTQADLRALNRDSLNNPRVRIVNRDAYSYLGRSAGTYDLIVCDFPDPLDRKTERLYGREYYRIARGKLSFDGLVAVQATGLPRSFSLIRDALRDVFPHVRAFRARYGDGQTTYFVLAGKVPLRKVRKVPPWAQALKETDAASPLTDKPSSAKRRPNVVVPGPPALCRTTLLDRYRHTASAAYTFDPGYRIVVLGPSNPCPESLRAPFVRFLAEEQPLLIYLPRPMRRKYGRLLAALGYRFRKSYRMMEYPFHQSNVELIKSWWKKLDNGAVSSIDARFCRSDEDPEIARLMEGYFLDYGHRYLDLAANRDVLGRRLLHLIVRDGKNEPAVMMVLTANFNVEIIHGRGGPRTNILGILLCLKYLEQSYGKSLTFQAATPNIEGFMLKLGALRKDWLDVFTPD